MSIKWGEINAISLHFILILLKINGKVFVCEKNVHSDTKTILKQKEAEIP